jgi:hypothetical protein
MICTYGSGCAKIKHPWPTNKDLAMAYAASMNWSGLRPRWGMESDYAMPSAADGAPRMGSLCKT